MKIPNLFNGTEVHKFILTETEYAQAL
ncbi:DUF735 family protein, partial [Borreliella burgdorferi]|nr:DUF735 family protein [Borreliella burgdorferi]MCD2372260.1 DUF735 family protein [Borreliella burgdorferi]